jgi:hypothetical protein
MKTGYMAEWERFELSRWLSGQPSFLAGNPLNHLSITPYINFIAIVNNIYYIKTIIKTIKLL